MSRPKWEYGFYDSHPDGNWADEPKPQANPTIWWYIFGMPFTTIESADRSGRKSVYGEPIVVRRRKGSTDWEHVTPRVAPTETTEETT